MITHAQIQAALNSQTKPPGSLGKLEDLGARLAYIQQSLQPQASKKRIILFAASHGISAENVSPYPAEVTAQMVLNFIQGGAAINVLCRQHQIDLHVADVGVHFHPLVSPPATDHFHSHPVRSGTRNFAHEPAMTDQEAYAALATGRAFARQAQQDGIHLTGLGEMGIGNTSSAAALSAALLNLPVAQLTGRGTGADPSMLEHKRVVLARALELHRPLLTSPLAKLCCLGGFELAAMTGFILECAQLRLPVVLDGFIVTTSALLATQMQPEVSSILFYSHRSQEQGHSILLEHLQAQPLLDLQLRLGEGTGVALAMPLLESAARLLSEMATFTTAGVSAKK